MNQLFRLPESQNSELPTEDKMSLALKLGSLSERSDPVNMLFETELSGLAVAALQDIFGLNLRGPNKDLELSLEMMSPEQLSHDFKISCLMTATTVAGSMRAVQATDFSDTEWHEVQKRDFLNYMIHGSASAIQEYFHLLRAELEKVEPGLYELSRDLMKTADALLMSEDERTHSKAVLDHSVGGFCELDIGEDGRAKVIAKAATFPLLLHEGAKGIVEYLASCHGQPEDHALTAKVLAFCDNPQRELAYLQQGKEVWKKVWSSLEGKDNREKVVSLIKLIEKSADEFNKKIEELLCQPQ